MADKILDQQVNGQSDDGLAKVKNIMLYFL